jgi:hypothetical protein
VICLFENRYLLGLDENSMKDEQRQKILSLRLAILQDKQRRLAEKSGAKANANTAEGKSKEREKENSRV